MRFRMKPGMGKHYTRRNGQRCVLRPGDEIDCDRHQLGSAIRKFEQLEPDPPPPQPKVGLKAVHLGFGKWDVINQATGVKINDEPLNKQEAKELRTSVALDSSKEESANVTQPAMENEEQ